MCINLTYFSKFLTLDKIAKVGKNLAAKNTSDKATIDNIINKLILDFSKFFIKLLTA